MSLKFSENPGVVGRAFPVRRFAFCGAFTLIELLVVIAIIGIIAGMVVGMSQGASRAKKDKFVKAEIQKLVTYIDNYHAKMGFYPPDNANLALLPPGVAWGSQQYEEFTASNQLLYELTGAISSNNNQNFITFDSNIIGTAEFNTMYDRGGVANSDPSQPQLFFNPPPNPNDYTNYPGQTGQYQLKGLTLPIETMAGSPAKTVYLNFWHYDASTTNRHNPSSYDLWAEYFVGRDHAGNPIMRTNGNW